MVVYARIELVLSPRAQIVMSQVGVMGIKPPLVINVLKERSVLTIHLYRISVRYPAMRRSSVQRALVAVV